MDRLILLVVGVRQEHRRQPVKAEHAIWLWIIDPLALALLFQRLVIWMMLHGERHADAKVFEPHIHAR